MDKDTAAPGDTKGLGQGSLQGWQDPDNCPMETGGWDLGMPGGGHGQIRGCHSSRFRASGTPRGIGTPKATELSLGVGFWAHPIGGWALQAAKG